MNAFIMVVFWTMMAFAFLGGIGSRNVLAQQSSGAGQNAEKLPPDIHPETLSRMPRPKREDFTTEDDRKAFDRVYSLSPKQSVSKWLGPTGTRLQIPELAEIYNEQIKMLHKKSGLEPKYAELTILIGAREVDDKSAFLAHKIDALEQHVSPKAVEVVRTNQDTKGLDEKEAVIIQFGRELFRQPKVSSKTFAAAERNFGRKGTLGMTLFLCYYESNGLLMRAYDQRMDTSAACVSAHNGCNSEKNPSPTW
jgi:4-carboxymuconolactone decarboxylase